jgi:hypothetical protein
MSSKNTKTHFLSRGARVVFIDLWKVAGAPINPMAITLNSKCLMSLKGCLMFFSRFQHNLVKSSTQIKTGKP